MDDPRFRRFLPPKEEDKTILERAKIFVLKFLRLIFVQLCYTFAFIAVTRLIWWLYSGWRTEPEMVYVITWIEDEYRGPSIVDVLQMLIINCLLFIAFGFQHTLMTERHLIGSLYHQKMFIDWKLNKGIYTVTSAFMIVMLVKYWEVIPVYVWYNPDLNDYVYWVHTISWLIIYGSCIVQDMPELCGFDQALLVDNSPKKSNRFRRMLKRQRHLGVIPFSVVAVFTEAMTLDRVLFLVFLVGYSYAMWKEPSTESFDYIREMSSRKMAKIVGISRSALPPNKVR